MASIVSIPDSSAMALRAALAASITKGTLVDATYYLYCQRASGRKAKNPRPIFANSTIMRSSCAFFAEQLTSSLLVDGEIPGEIGDYDYETDSDLDEDEAPDTSDRSVLDIDAAQPSKEQLDRLKPSEDHNATKPAEVSATQPPSRLSGHTKYRIFVPNVAATTWQALIYFVYTGEVFFAPFNSLGEASRLAKKEHCQRFSDGPPMCSPKSMYRLAKLVKLDDLTQLAKDAIETNLSEATIADEVFSHFSSSHPIILAMQLDYLYDPGRLTRVMPRIRDHIQATTLGAMPHATPVLGALLAQFARVLRGLRSPPSPTDPAEIVRLAAYAGRGTAPTTAVGPAEPTSVREYTLCRHRRELSKCKSGACKRERKEAMGGSEMLQAACM